MGLKAYKIFIKLFLGALFASGLLWRCANMVAPLGGPKDSLPPRIVAMTPAYGTTHFTAKRIYIEFDEYVVLKDQVKEFYVSPHMGQQPVLTIKGRGVQIELKDSLKENQTYSLNFCGSIRDNNEDNPLNDFRYVFSTGAAIDSLLMSGYTVDGYTRDSVSKTFIFFYDARRDSTARDSLLFRQPDAIARAQANGLFIAENLKPIPYRVYALEDKNDNRLYEPGVERVAFLDSTYNPAAMPGFSIRYDTTRKYNIPDPQLYFRMFMDEGFKRQYLSKNSRPSQHRIDLVFGAKYPVIDTLRLEGIDSAQIITQYLKPTRDSLTLWLDIPSEQLPDTIRGSITYHKHDSLNVLQPVTEPLSLVWRYIEPKKRDKNDTIQVNPFKYKVEARTGLNPYNNIPITFEIPIAKIDSAACSLTRIDIEENIDSGEKEEKRFDTRFGFVRDTADMLRWVIRAQWVLGGRYELLIPSGALVNVAGQKNDTLKASFSVLPAERFSVIELNVIGKTPQSEYVLHLIDQSGRLLRETRHVRTGKYTFDYLEAGTVRIRVIEDMNGNGQWDGGNLIERRQPERAEIFVQEKGESDLVLKENWTYDYNLDMSLLFAPITMESTMEQLRKMEAERIQKMLKQRAEQQARPKSNQSGGMGFGGIGSGGGIPFPR